MLIENLSQKNELSIDMNIRISDVYLQFKQRNFKRSMTSQKIYLNYR